MSARKSKNETDANDPDEDSSSVVDTDQATLDYVRLSKAVSKDELHEQIARKGLSVLSRGIPYVVQAARWQRIDKARRDARALPLETDLPDTGQMVGPFDATMADEARRDLLEALTDLPDADVLAVWRHAEGWSDDEIALAIEELGGGRLTSAGVRKRRERALARLRSRMSTKGQ